MMPTIRIDDDVFSGLKALAEPFVDTPNSVIRRLLEEHRPAAKLTAVPVAAQDPTYNQPAKRPVVVQQSKQRLTPQPIYEKFLLHVLAAFFNGSGKKHEVTDKVIELMNLQGFIGPADLARVSTGETKAQNTVAWGRNALKDRGLISSTSAKGVWELTPEGMQEGKAVVLPQRT